MKILSFIVIYLVLNCYGHFISKDVQEKINRWEINVKKGNIKAPPEQWLEQKVDHFDPTNPMTYQQRFYINDTYWKTGNPIFMFVGAEGSASGYWVVDSAMMVYAKKFGAMGIMLEHRYYGLSQPYDDLATDHMKYLSSRQALHDLATFKEYINEKFSSPNTKWIAFGGSYGGTLAGLLRLKYPHSYAGAIADSGPLFAKLDFFEFNEVATNAIRNSQNGQVCSENIKKSFSIMEEMAFSESGRDKLYKDMNLCHVISSSNDSLMTISNINDEFMGIVQYNKYTNGVSDIDNMCKVFSGSDHYQMLVNFIKPQSGCFKSNYTEYIQRLRNTTINNDSMIRQWIYQTCTEFGWYQTASSDKQIFGKALTLDFSLQICKDSFGITPTEKMMKETNSYYGGYSQSGTNILWTNGGVDPWHAMSIIESDSQDIVFIPSASHCIPLYSPKQNDLESVKIARLQAEHYISKYLN